MGDESIKNWIKATELLKQHDKSDWHLASVERQLMSSLASTSGGGICEIMLSIGEKEKEKNRILVKILLRSLYFLIKNHIPHTTMFEGVLTSN